MPFRSAPSSSGSRCLRGRWRKRSIALRRASTSGSTGGTDSSTNTILYQFSEHVFVCQRRFLLDVDRRPVHDQPVNPERLDRLHELVEVVALDQETVGATLVALDDVAVLFGLGEDDHGDVFGKGIRPDATQHL